ncbi:MAG: hypothetical protein RL328_1901 [Acidobacteriota bacterium]|jgi:hypothetical protein
MKIASLLFFLATAIQGADYVIIANSSLGDAQITASDLKQIFLGVKTTVGGQHVEPVVAQAGLAHRQFVLDCLGKSETGLKHYYRMALFSGRSSMPRAFATEDEIVAFVARTKGAIGYVSDSANLAGVVRLRTQP